MTAMTVGPRVNDIYAASPFTPDPLPTVRPSYNTPDTDERDPHNYPGPPAPRSVEDGGNPFHVRGYADTGPCFGPGDVSNDLRTQGLFPWIRRSVLAPNTIDPLPARYFKPPKSTVRYSDLYEAPRRQRGVHGDPSIVGMTREYVEPYTKLHSGVGALNNYWPDGMHKDFGFANGQKFTFRHGGFHPRARYFRMPERQQKQLYFRIGNPDKAVGRSGSLYAQQRGPLGFYETPYNSYVKEYHREPMPYGGGLVKNRLRANPSVVLPWTNRPEQHLGWSGPPGTTAFSQEGLRILNAFRDVIPNKTTQFSQAPYSNPVAVVSKKGPQTVNPTELRPTNKECIVDAVGRNNDPSPFFAKGDNAAYNTEYWTNTTVRELTAGPGVTHVAPGVINSNETADVRCDKRINPTVPRRAPRGNHIYFCAVRPPNSDRTLAPQYTQWAAPKNRKVTPPIEREIDPSLIQPWLQNPYTQPVVNYQ